METPSSTRRVTRSQTKSIANTTNSIPMSKKFEESENSGIKSKQRTGNKPQDRSALIDITNDSPIVGLAMGNLETPSSEMSKKRIGSKKARFGTPGSGEALLRGQVKTLLQKVEEEAVLSKISLEKRPFIHLQGFVNSPMNLLAPTPANTPQIFSLSATESNGLGSVSISPVEDKLVISQMVSEIFEGKKQEGLESEKDLVTRSLFSEFSEKSEGGFDSSDDASSVWSLQANASSSIRDDAEDIEEEGLLEDEKCNEIGLEEGVEEEYDEALMIDDLCEGISKMNMNIAKPAGKHTRFMYNSDGELVAIQEEWIGENEFAEGGKHLRFLEDSDEL